MVAIKFQQKFSKPLFFVALLLIMFSVIFVIAGEQNQILQKKQIHLLLKTPENFH